MRWLLAAAVLRAATCWAHPDDFKMTKEQEELLARFEKEKPIEISIKRRGPGKCPLVWRMA